MEETLELEQIKQQHIDNYKKAILELINNNTRVLYEDDVMSLINKPPLDSMDVIKTKFLDIAKKNKIILNTEQLDKMMDKYRSSISKTIFLMKKIRVNCLTEIVDSSDSEIFKLNKKDFISINKKIKKEIKMSLKKEIEKNIVKNVNLLFTSNCDDLTKERCSKEFIKYVSGSYQRQLIENIDFKVIVKDTTLINGIKEHGERYQFMKEKSHLLNSKIGN